MPDGVVESQQSQKDWIEEPIPGKPEDTISNSQPVEETAESQSTEVKVVLDQKCRIGPKQTSNMKVCLCNSKLVSTMQAGILTPKEEVLAAQECDLLEGL